MMILAASIIVNPLYLLRIVIPWHSPCPFSHDEVESGGAVAVEDECPGRGVLGVNCEWVSAHDSIFVS